MESIPPKTIQKHQENRISKKVKILFAGGIIGFVLGALVCIARIKEEPEKEPIATTIDRTITEDNYTLTISNVEETLKPASDLISTKYYYTDANTYENYKELFGKRVPFTTDKIVFVYDGVINVGIDLSEVNYEINNENKVIVIELPEIKVLSNEIDEESFEFPYVSESVFNKTQMSDYTELIGKLKAEKEEELLENTRFMDGAMKNTQDVLEQFLTVAETTKEYVVIFK